MSYVVNRLVLKGRERRFCRDRQGIARHGRMTEENSIVRGVRMRCSLLRGMSSNRVFVPPANEAYAYDADGNMTEDARFRYYWNGENRMIRAEEKSAPSGRQPYVIAYAYDHMGRNVIKNGAKFIWDDYNIIVEDAASSNATFNTWGIDIDGTMQGAGGIGGLLAVEKGDAVYLPAYDANGNITEYVDAEGVIAAHYAYSAFGKQLLTEDEIGFTHRFSTKPYCAKTGLVEFEFRKYVPNVGRWMSRDPLEELSGCALMVYSINNPVGNIDTHGLRSVCKTVIYAGHRSSIDDEFIPRMKKRYPNPAKMPCTFRMGAVSCNQDDANKVIEEKFPGHLLPNMPRRNEFLWKDNAPARPDDGPKATDAIQKAWDAAIKNAEEQCKDEQQCCSAVEISVECDKDMAEFMKEMGQKWCGRKERKKCPEK